MDIEFRKAELNDVDLLFKWANDKVVRQNAFNKESIEYENHFQWFENKIKSRNTHIYICYIDEVPVGQIRVECENDIGMIGYSIDEKYRGKGIGTCILTNINKVLKAHNIKLNKLIGRVLYQNIPSQKAFIKSEFNEVRCESYIEYVKDIKKTS